MATRYPAYIPANFYGATPTHMMATLLLPSVTSIPGTVRLLSDVTALEIAAGGNYVPAAGSWGLTKGAQLPDFVVNYDDATGKTEFSAPTSILISNAFFTVSFRWVVISSDNDIVTTVDYGATQALTAQPLVLTVAASTELATSWPIVRWNRVGA